MECFLMHFKKVLTMKKKLHISIPKPCHEDWSAMTPNEKGKFCNSCAKTVVDFTKKSVSEIQEFFIENQYKKVCGHFYKTQLDSITIEIPREVIFQQRSFSKMFLLALIIAMGSTLMSCNNTKGEKQKINQVILIDSITNGEKQIDSIVEQTKIDTIIEVKNDTLIPPPPRPIIEIPELTGDIVVGLPAIIEPPIEKNDSIIEIKEPLIEECNLVFGMISVEKPPRFMETNASTKDLKKVFTEKITTFVTSRFDTKMSQNLDLSEGKHKIVCQFTIDKNGYVIDIKVKAPHQKLEKHVLNILKQLPQFIPGEQRNKPVQVKYTLPITFVVE